MLAPGPNVPKQPTGFPLSRPYISAMKATPCSCRVKTKRMESDFKEEYKVGVTFPWYPEDVLNALLL